MKRPRILIVTTGLAHGGAEVQLVVLARILKDRDWDVRIVSLMPPKAYIEELKAASIPVISLDIEKKWPNPRPFFTFTRFIRQWRPHIVHSHMVHANLFTRLARITSPIPSLICTAHNIDEGGRFREFLYRITDPFCDLTTQVSRAGLERYISVHAAPSRKICHIPNGIDTKEFCPDYEARSRLRGELGIQKDFIWLAAGRFYPSKNYPNLINAFAQLLRKYPKVKLVIAGEGPLRPSIEDYVNELGIGNRVRFLGIRNDMTALMNSADAFVMSSAWEGLPLVLLEAGSSGLPVVATDVGGNREIVQNGRTGFIVQANNPEELTEGMARLMRMSERERHRMGESAKEYIEKAYSINNVVDTWEELYYSLINQAPEKASYRSFRKHWDRNIYGGRWKG